MFNSITAIGYLAADPETRHTQSGKCVCKFRICVSDKQAKTPLFINVDTWDKTAEVCGQYLAKGRMVCVSGELCDNSYTNKEGTKINSVCINATKVKFIGSGENRQESNQNRNQAASPPNDHSVGADYSDDDDIPF